MNAPVNMHRNGNGRGWTADMDEVLRRERADGKSFSEAIAVVNSLLGTSMTRNAAIGRASRLGIPGRKQPPPKPKAPPRLKPPVKSVMRAVPVISANGGLSFRLKPKTVLVEQSIEAVPLEIGPNAVSFFDAKRCQCRWPYGDPRDLATFRFCGEPAFEDRPYCAPHHLQSRGQPT